jgi:hypothetical protein
MRLISCVGVLTTGVLILGGAAGIAWADTGDTSAADSETAAVTSKSDNGDAGAEHDGAENADQPKSTFGNGRDDVDVQAGKDVQDGKDGKKKNNPGTKKFKNFFTIPVPRIPKPDELPANGLPNPDLFYTTLVVPVPTLAELLTAMQPQPHPTPTPRPTFRTQDEAPPVVDSEAGGGGAVESLSGGGGSRPPVVHAPVVIAPPPMQLPAPRPAASVRTAEIPAPAAPADVVVAGAQTPPPRGVLQPAAPAARALASSSGEATRFGYPRSFRDPSAGELALVALPGVAGLLMLTLSGGVIGYRQAESARVVRTEAAGRFLR